MKYASFDLEIALEIPQGDFDLKKAGPLGITCIGVALSDTKKEIYWHEPGQLSKEECKEVVREFWDLAEQGYTFLTWNGLGFDFRVLAEESGMRYKCAKLALEHHVDMMLYVTFVKGWYLSLQSALEGAGCKGKLKEVILKSGDVLKGMEGSQAPALWKAGEYDAVLRCLQSDILQPLDLVQYIEQHKEIVWTSKAGKPQCVLVPEMLLAYECYLLPEPDTSWMDSPPTREGFIEWVPQVMKDMLLTEF